MLGMIGDKRVRTWSIGDVAVTSIEDLDPFRLELHRLFPAAGMAMLEPHRHELVPDHFDADFSHIRLAVQAFLLQVDGKRLLIDTCIGEHKPRPRLAEWDGREDTGFLRHLKAAGAEPDDIDFVFCTHLHADHVGWNTRWHKGRWVPTFPRARYLIGRTEHAYFSSRPEANHGSFFDSVTPIFEAGLVDLVDDGFSFLRGLTLLPLPGHSPGQMGLLVDRLGEKALFCGDAVHSPAQIFVPDLSSAFCSDPDGAADLRKDLFARIADERRTLVPAHFRNSGRALIERCAFAGYRPRFELL